MNTRFKNIAAILILGFIMVGAVMPENIFINGEADNKLSDEKIIRDIIEKQYPGFVRSGDAEGYAASLQVMLFICLRVRPIWKVLKQ